MPLVRTCVFFLALLVGVASCSGGVGLPDAGVPDAPAASGRFTVAWTLADGARVLTCEDVGAQLLTVTVTGPAIGGGYAEAFTCANGVGTSKELPVGVVDLTFELVGRSGSLSTPPAQRLTIPRDGTVTAAPLALQLQAQGGLNARLVAGPTSNCAVAGANLTALSLVLEKGGACVPATFAIAAAGGRPASTYVSTCAVPAPTTVCVERDQAVTTTVGSGSYVVRVRGFQGAAPCWIADQLADIPPLQRTLTVDIGLADQKGSVGCP